MLVSTDKKWDYALGMIKVDGLEPSPEFKKLIEKESRGEMATEDMRKVLDKKYKMKNWPAPSGGGLIRPGRPDEAFVVLWTRIGSFAGIQIFLDNFIYAVMVCRMVNAVSESGNYRVANNFIWGWMLIPLSCFVQIIQKIGVGMVVHLAVSLVLYMNGLKKRRVSL